MVACVCLILLIMMTHTEIMQKQFQLHYSSPQAEVCSTEAASSAPPHPQETSMLGSCGRSRGFMDLSWFPVAHGDELHGIISSSVALESKWCIYRHVSSLVTSSGSVAAAGLSVGLRGEGPDATRPGRDPAERAPTEPEQGFSRGLGEPLALPSAGERSPHGSGGTERGRWRGVDRPTKHGRRGERTPGNTDTESLYEAEVTSTAVGSVTLHLSRCGPTDGRLPACRSLQLVPSQFC